MAKKINYWTGRDGRVPIFAITILAVMALLILVGLGFLFGGGLPGVG